MNETTTPRAEAGHERDRHVISCPHCKHQIEMLGTEVIQPSVECVRCHKHEPKGSGFDTAIPVKFLNEQHVSDAPVGAFQQGHLCTLCMGILRMFVSNGQVHNAYTRFIPKEEVE